MAYTKTAWVNDTTPAINATNLNKMETGIYDAHVTADGAIQDDGSVPMAANLDLGSNSLLNIGNISGDMVGTTDTQTLTNKTLQDFTNAIHADGTHTKVYNDTGGTLTQDSLVYISGFNVGNDCVEVALADADDGAKMPCVGLVESDINDGTTGVVLAFGIGSALVSWGASEAIGSVYKSQFADVDIVNSLGITQICN